ncbi:lipid hydroperoxide peroxidase, partial [Acidimicrobium ferrooxidans]|nr:lipid hydroperoxide peroxidase [Acidimicrobium ferrooxidans]
QTRFCREAKISRTVALSDHRTLSFGEGYGVAIEELRMLSRAIFVLDAENRIQYCEYVTEISDHPNYETAIAAVKKLAT